MKKILTEEQFLIAVKNLNITEKTKFIAYQVLVKGVKQIDLANKLNLSKGNISHAVNKVFNAYSKSNIPLGYKEITVILPDHQVFIVEQWAKKIKVIL